MVKPMMLCLGLLWGAAAPSSCENATQVASACEGGLCPDAPSAPLDGPRCALGSLGIEVAYVGDGYESTLGGLCLGRELPKAADGSVDCRLLVRWGEGDALTESHCTRVGGTLEPGGCSVRQFVQDQLPEPGTETGWYFDTTSEEVRSQCAPARQQRVAFLPGLLVEETGSIRLLCDYALANADDVSSLNADTGTTFVRPGACAAPKTGTPAAAEIGRSCTPEVLPVSYDMNESLVEPANSECSTGVCLVHQLEGSLRDDANCDEVFCPHAEELRDRVYCSCRCDADEPGDAPLCDCPNGFSCQALIAGGPAAGSYCVLSRTISE